MHKYTNLVQIDINRLDKIENCFNTKFLLRSDLQVNGNQHNHMTSA